VIEAADLRLVALLRHLPVERLKELATNGREVVLEPGGVLFRQGDHAEFLSLLLEGELESTRAVAGDELPLLHHTGSGFLGAISLLTGDPYGATTKAVTKSRLFLLEPGAFRRLMVEDQTVFERVISVFTPVIGGMQTIDRDREKLLALGSLSAGLAHELNNPAAAAQRAAAELAEADTAAQAALARMADAGLQAASMGRLCAFTAEALEAGPDGPPVDPLERADRESELAKWLEARGVEDSTDAASALLDAGLDESWVERLLGEVDAAPADALAWIGSRVTAARLARDLEAATTRISELVQAVRQYSYLDQAPVQEVDVHDGLESTLAILGHKLSEKRIEVVREYDRSLPRIEAHAPELNQVWTNLIDNAVSAVGEGGRIIVRTLRQGEFLAVEIEDDGPGVPAEVRDRIFDPFFTTKGPGEGTGLGLDIVRRIVLRHHGDIRVKPVERGACFQVLLPLA
jgi:signal transduction histidine kinase